MFLKNPRYQRAVWLAPGEISLRVNIKNDTTKNEIKIV